MEQSLMEKIFSNERNLSSLPSMKEGLDESELARLDDIMNLMSRISPVEADLVELHLLKGVPQGVLGQIFGYTQPNIHYRLERGKSRLKVLLDLPEFKESELRRLLSGFFTDKKDIEVMVLMYKYSSQSKVAEVVGESQGKVRYRFMRCMKSLERSETLEHIYKAYQVIEANLTLLRKAEPQPITRTIL